MHMNVFFTFALLIIVTNTWPPFSTEKENVGKAIPGEIENHIIMTVPGTGAIIGSVIIGKVYSTLFENTENPVFFAGIGMVIKESGRVSPVKSISKRGDSH